MKTLSLLALDVLSTGIDVDGNKVRIARNLDRKLYVEVNAALEAIGGAWNRKAKAHLFDEEPADALDQILTDGGFHDRKRDFEQFFTPPVLAREVVARIGVRGHVVLEPSAGHGALVGAALAAGAESVVCVEKDPKCVAVLKPMSKLDVFERDFLTCKRNDFRGEFSRIVMNPPFSRQRDIDHVANALSLLARGGKLAAIMSAGVSFRTDRKTVGFRDLIARRGGKIEKLPDGSFDESGTSVRTVLVTVGV